jgi:hypothetical protein
MKHFIKHVLIFAVSSLIYWGPLAWWVATEDQGPPNPNLDGLFLDWFKYGLFAWAGSVAYFLKGIGIGSDSRKGPSVRPAAPTPLAAAGSPPGPTPM